MGLREKYGKAAKKKNQPSIQTKLAEVESQYRSGVINDSTRIERRNIIIGVKGKPKAKATADSAKIYRQLSDDLV